MPASPVVVADFNRSLVRERTLPRWCRARLRTGSLRALADIAVRGPLALLLDRLPGCELLSARIGIGAFRGATPDEVAAWACTALTINPRALDEISRLRCDP